MFKVVIVEDEMPILELMKHVIGQNPRYAIVGAFSNPFEALDCLREQQPDVIFLDIEMPRMNGLELAKRANELTVFSKIVFTTAYANYALDAFRVYAFDYLLKPVTPAAIERLANRLALLQTQSASPEKKQSTTSISCFGAFEVRNPAGALIRWPTRKTEELFAFFACHPDQDISKWQLMDALWADMTQDRAIHNLHNTMYRLKKLVKEQAIELQIKKTIDGYMMEAGSCEYDVRLFRQAESAAGDEPIHAEKAEQLCARYNGVLLEKKDYLWKAPLEVRFGRQFTAMTKTLVQGDLERGEWKKAEQRLEAFLAMYPIHEEMNVMLWALYARSGHVQKVSKQYERFERMYHGEMDMEPSQELRDWVESIIGRTHPSE